MEYKVMISVEGCLTGVESDEPDTMELFTEGFLTLKEGGYSLRYTESDLTGMEGTETVFDVSGDTITLTHSGDVSSQLVFKQDQKHYSIYETPYGALTVGINSYFVEHGMDGLMGFISVDYDIEIEHAMTGSNSIRITFAPAEE